MIDIGDIGPDGKILKRSLGMHNVTTGEVTIGDRSLSGSADIGDLRKGFRDIPITMAHELFHALHRIGGNKKSLLPFVDSPQGQEAIAFINQMRHTSKGLEPTMYKNFGQIDPKSGKRLVSKTYTDMGIGDDLAAERSAGELITVYAENSSHFEKSLGQKGRFSGLAHTYLKHVRNILDFLNIPTNITETGGILVPPDFGTAQQPSRRIPINKARGGMIYASEGQMIEFTPKGTDTVPAMLTPGEFVVNRKATRKNLPLLHSINNGTQYLEPGGEVEDPFGSGEGGMTYKQRQAKRRKDARESKQQLKRQFALRKLGIGTMGMRAVFEMVTAPNTFDMFNEEAIVQAGDYAQKTINGIKKRTEEQISDDHKRDYLLSKGKDLTNRFRYLARITNNSRLLLKRAGARLDKPIPPEVDLRGVGRGFTIKSILERQVASGIAEGNSIKKIDEELRKKYARFVPEAGINPAVATRTGTPSPVYASRGMFIPRGTDTVPAMLTPGEFIVNRQAAQANMPLLNSINKGTQYLENGGVAGGQTAIGGFSNVLTNITRSLGQFTSVIEQITQASQGTTPTDAGGVNTNGIAQFTQNFGNFIEQLQSITFPDIINVQGTVTANVNVAGGDAFARLAQESISSIVNSQLSAGFDIVEQDTEGQIRNPFKR